jgi:hypothetical protein
MDCGFESRSGMTSDGQVKTYRQLSPTCIGFTGFNQVILVRRRQLSHLVQNGKEDN